MKASGRFISKIKADIYGLQNGLIIEHGLADAYDSEDFLVKLQSLEDVWNNLVTGFYNWFLRQSSRHVSHALRKRLKT